MNLENQSGDYGRTQLKSNLNSISRPQLERDDLYLILQITPHDSVIAMELARQLSTSGQLEEASKVLGAVVKMDYRFETLFALGQAEYELQQDEQALDHLHQASMVAPEDSSDLFELYKLMGNVFVRLRSFELAEDSYNRAHRIDPDSDVLQVNLGALAIQRQDWDSSLFHFRKAVESSRANDKAWVGLAIGHRMKGDLDLAWGNLLTAIELNPLNDSAMNLIVDWGLGLGKETEVHGLVRNYLCEGGWSESLSLVFAALCMRRGEVAIAKLEVERVLAVNPKHENALQMALQLRSRGQV